MTAAKEGGVLHRTKKNSSSPPMAGTAAAEWVSIDKLLPWTKNPRHNTAAVDKVAASLKEFGFGAPVVARRANFEIIAGHTRVLAARKLGLDLVPVRLVDLDETEAHVLALADNRLGEIATWDDAELAIVLRDLKLENADLGLTGFSDEELARLFADPAVLPSVEEPEGTDLEPPAVPESVPGELYQLGPHRLLCGDATVASDWDALLQGQLVDMVWTDPPYGVSYVGKTTDALTIQNDALDEGQLQGFLRDAFAMVYAHCREGGAWYVAHPPGPLNLVFGNLLHELGVLRQTLVWVKDQFVMGRSDYHYRHEPIHYGWKPGAAHSFVDDRTQDSVWEIERPKRNAEHPTMKPVELVRRAIRNSSTPGQLVVDCFGGSGTTLIAAAQEGRVARLLEKDCRYADVIRKRWTALARAAGIDPGTGALG